VPAFVGVEWRKSGRADARRARFGDNVSVLGADQSVTDLIRLLSRFETIGQSAIETAPLDPALIHSQYMSGPIARFVPAGAE